MGNGSVVYELVSLGPPANGWRATYSNGSSDVPLAFWGVFRKTRHANGHVEDLGTSMEGIWADSQPHGPVRSFNCAADSDGFEGYLPPT